MRSSTASRRWSAIFPKPSSPRFSMTMRGASIASTRSERGALTSAGALRFAGGKLSERGTRFGEGSNASVDVDIRLGPSRPRVRCGARRTAATAPASTASASRAPITPAASFSREVRSERSTFPRTARSISTRRRARWEGLAIQPKVAEVILEGGDVLRELVRRRDAGGLKVCCWTVCLHNTRLGMLHPGAVTRNAFGDPNYYNLCPSNPDARAYVCALVEDLTHSYEPDLVELESPSFMGFAHGYHHDKDGVGLAAEDDFALSLCFCDSCLARAKKAGVDGGSGPPHCRAMDRRGLRAGRRRNRAFLIFQRAASRLSAPSPRSTNICCGAPNR